MFCFFSCHNNPSTPCRVFKRILITKTRHQGYKTTQICHFLHVDMVRLERYIIHARYGAQMHISFYVKPLSVNIGFLRGFLIEQLYSFCASVFYTPLFIFVQVQSLEWGLQTYKANCHIKSAQLVVELWMTPQNRMPQGFQPFQECTHAVLGCSCSDNPSNGAVLSVCQITGDLYLCNSSPAQSSDTQT